MKQLMIVPLLCHMGFHEAKSELQDHYKSLLEVEKWVI